MILNRVNKIFLLLLTSFLLQSSISASEDYICYSDDETIWFTGKTSEDRFGNEKFLNTVQVYINSKKVAYIRPHKMEPGSTPHKFKYIDKRMNVSLNWFERKLCFSFQDKENSFSFEGKLICE